MGLALALGATGVSAFAEDQQEPVPYDRGLYRHWTDADSDCRDTREEVLIAESQSPVELDERGCKVVGGYWYDPYLGERVSDPALLDVDHFVPLAEAHRSGAHSWTPERREAYANDLTHAETLIATTFKSNRSKGSSDPADWLPPNEAYRCEYVRTWVIVKATWGLASDEDEDRAVREVLESCRAASGRDRPDESESRLTTLGGGPTVSAVAVGGGGDPTHCAAPEGSGQGDGAGHAQSCESESSANPLDGSSQAAAEQSGGSRRGCTDINTASSAELEAVSGIGPATLANLRAADFCVADHGPVQPAADSRPDAVAEKADSQAGSPATCTNVNAATSATLQAVSGIGPARAKAIIEHRERNGPFGRLDQLLEVSGVGPSTLRNFRAAGYCAQ